MQTGVGLLILDVMPIYWSLPGYRHIYLRFYQLPNGILLPTMCYFLREATSEIYGPRVYSLLYLLWDLYFCFLFSDLSFQKPKNTLMHFFFTYFISCFCKIYLSNLPQFNLSLYRRGIESLSYASGCKYLFFGCRYHLHSVAWFSY